MSSLPILAGCTSTVIFAASTLPMLAKAYRTRDVASYSLGNLVLANLGNAVHSLYVFSLPVGPLWFLHGFYLLTSAFMLCSFLGQRAGVRAVGASTHGVPDLMRRMPDAAGGPVLLASVASSAAPPGGRR
jgi:hypothetical protein